MKSIALILALILTLSPSGNDKPADMVAGAIGNNSDVVGYTPGEFSVSASGTAHYNVPLLFPKGTAGMTPSLSLVYNSSGGDGILGLGWNLQGLSAITRVPRTLEKDYEIDPVDFDDNDRYALDSERMILVSDDKEYSESGAEYRLEQNNFCKIVADGQISDRSSIFSSPEKFIVYTKDGLIKEYGGDDNSRVSSISGAPVSWHLSKISDRNGNYILFEYENENNAVRNIVPKYIYYTGNENAGIEPYVRISFGYFDRQPTVENAYLKFGLRQIYNNNRILNNIAIQFKEGNSWDSKRWYSFGYGSNSIGQKYIEVLNQCTQNKCLNSTEFKWDVFTDDSYGLDFLGDIDKSYYYNHDFHAGDWNGDGYSDILLTKSDGTNIFLDNWRLNRGLFRAEKINPILFQYFSDSYAITADFNNDGFSDILTIAPESGRNAWFINNGNDFDNLSFTTYNDLIPRKYFKTFKYTNSYGDQAHPKEVKLGDFNGDGFIDIFTYDVAIGLTPAQTQEFNDETFRHGFHENQCNSGIGFSTTRISGFDDVFKGNYINWNGASPSFGQIDVVDINADGLSDIVVFNQTDNPLTSGDDDGVIRPYINHGKGYSFAFEENGYLIDRNHLDKSSSGTDKLDYADFNADGLIDILYTYQGIGGKGAEIYYNRGINLGWEDYKQDVPEILNFGEIQFSSIKLIDFNADGRSDIFVRSQDKKSFQLFSNRGTYFKRDIYRANINETAQISIGSFQNKNLIDILVRNNPTNGSSDYLTAMSINAKPNSRITSIIEGHGKTIDIEYSSLLDEEVYTKYDDGDYPMYDFITRMPVAKRYCVTDGLGGKNCVNYKYYGGKLHLEGRGFRGFAKVEITDETLGLTTTNKYFQDYRVLQTPLKSSIKTRVGQVDPIAELSTFRPYQEDNNGDIIFPQIVIGANDRQYFFTANAASTIFNFDLNGNLISKTNTRDSFDFHTGNLIEKVIDYSEGYKDSIVNFYQDNIDNWILGRITRSEVYKFSPNNSVVKRTSAFEYDAVTGQLIMEKSEPDLSAEMQVTTSYEYDQYGNITKKSTRFFNGYDFETRNIYKRYDARGRFISSVFNDLGHTKYMEHDEQFGYMVSKTDINGLTTSYKYDEFGRVVRTIFPDGNWSSTCYSRCTDCPTLAFFAKIDSSSVSPPVTTFFDTLGREIRTKTLDFSGQEVFVDSKFDNRGLLEVRSQPFNNGDSENWTKFTYDELGRERVSILPGGQMPSLQYQDDGRRTIKFDMLDRITYTETDLKGRVIKSVDQNDKELLYEYDGQGNLKEVEDSEGNSTLYTYDIYGNKTSMDDPNMGKYEYKYNPLGEMYWMKDPEGNEVNLYYDILGRLIERVELEGSTEWTYDGADNGTGMLQQVSNTDHSKVYYYDDLSRLRSVAETIGQKSFDTFHQYNTKSQLIKTSYPNGFAIKYIYNDFEYMSEIRNYMTNNLIWKADIVNQKGQLLKQTLGNGVETVYSYDDKNNWLKTIKSDNPFNGLEIQDLEYNYNPAGQIIRRSNNLSNKITDYEYDILYRLTSVEQTGYNPLLMEYDELGNITYKSDVGHYFYGENGAGPHQLTRIDSLFNPCIPSHEVNIDYTSFDKVKRIEKDSFTLEILYGVDRQRIQQRKFVGDSLTETKTYVGGIHEVIRTDTLHREVNLIKGSSGTFATHIIDIASNNGEEYIEYWHRDHQSSLEAITDQEGNVKSRFEYDPWGLKSKNQTSSLVSQLERGYTGHEHLEYFGLINMNGRMYDPVLGRFISPDPFIQDPLNLQNYNRYSYVLNDPVNLYDPSGYFFKRLGRSLFSGLKKIGQAHIDVFIKAPFELTNKAGAKIFGQETWTTIAVTTTSVVVGAVASFYLGPVAGGAAAGFASAFVGARIAGADFNTALEAGMIGGAIGAVTSYAGATFSAGANASLLDRGVELAGNGIIQGGIADLQGGNFGDAFDRSVISGAVGQTSNGLIGSMESSESAAYVIRAVEGGVVGEINGEGFINGAVTATYSNMLYEFSTPSRIVDELDAIVNQTLENIDSDFENFKDRAVALETKFYDGPTIGMPHSSYRSDRNITHMDPFTAAVIHNPANRLEGSITSTNYKFFQYSYGNPLNDVLLDILKSSPTQRQK